MTNNKILKVLKIFLTSLVLLWAISVYILSSQNAEESGNLSGKFIEKILEIKDNISSKEEKIETLETISNQVENQNVNNFNIINTNENQDTDNLKEKDSEKLKNQDLNKTDKKIEKEKSNNINKNRIKKWQKITRKMAHYTLYTIGGFLIYSATIAYAKSEKITKKKVSITLAIGIIYAIFDEIHQFFSDGRTPKVFDVIIDSLGIFTGLIIAVIIIGIINKIINYIYERGNKVND